MNDFNLANELYEKFGHCTDTQEQDPLAFPEDVMKGLAGDFAKVYSEVMEPPAHFFFLSFLTCLGSVLAGRVTLKSELQPQPRLYTVLLGESADNRKSTAISATVNFFQKALTDFPVCLGVGSAEGLQKKFATNDNVLLVFDELKSFIGKAKIESSVLLPCVCTLFELNRYESNTKTHELYLEKARLSFLSASTIETYERVWDSTFTDIGMTNRLFIVPGYGNRRFAIPKHIDGKEKAAFTHDLGERLKVITVTPELDLTPEAYKLYEHWYLNLERGVHNKRLDTYAMRFMILFAINTGKRIIDEEIIDDVITLMEWQGRARRRYDPIDADNVIAKVEEKIRRVLSVKPLSDRDLKRAVHYNRIGSWVFQNALRNLSQVKEIAWDKRVKRWGLQ
jgi:hypothetical protein